MLWHHVVGGLGTVYSWSFTYIHIYIYIFLFLFFYFGRLQVKLYLRQCSTFKNQKIKIVHMSNANFLNKFFVSFPYIIIWIQLVVLHIYDWSLTGSVPHRLTAQVYNALQHLKLLYQITLFILTFYWQFAHHLHFFTFVLVQKRVSSSQWTALDINTMWVQKRVSSFIPILVFVLRAIQCYHTRWQ